MGNSPSFSQPLKFTNQQPLLISLYRCGNYSKL